MTSEILAKVIRGETVESLHRGYLVAIDGNGRPVISIGDPNVVTFLRSASKPFQAMPLITCGAADHFGFSEEEIALACASHSGEPRHVRIVQLMLDRCGLTEAHLRCGTHFPFSEKDAQMMQRSGEAPGQLHNNCSGKHTAMLAFAKYIHADLSTYDAIEHPVQQTILETVAKFAEMPESEVAIGIDGCAAPNFAMPLASMARTYANLVVPAKFDEKTQAACRRIVDAMTRFPELIGGTDRLDTMIMQAAPGRVLSKVGADGVWLCGVLPSEKYPAGLGIALKIEDGDDKRARPVVAVEILRQFGVLSKDDLTDVSPMPIKNRRGDLVGRTETSLLEIIDNI